MRRTGGAPVGNGEQTKPSDIVGKDFLLVAGAAGALSFRHGVRSH
jgi:hypothetical protein